MTTEMDKALSPEPAVPNEFGEIPPDRVWFSDEQAFRIKEGGRNSQKNRLWTFSDDDPALHAQQGEWFSKSVMVPLAVSKCGTARLMVVGEGEKVHRDYHK